MREYKLEIRETKICINVTCDKCGLVLNEETDPYNIELQEMHSLKFTGGYSSVFGDGNSIECDICQNCLYEMIKDCYRVVD